MEYTTTKSGRRTYAKDFKLKVLKELDEGKTHHEVSNKYNVPVRYLYDWKYKMITNTSDSIAPSEDKVSISDFRKALDKIKKLERALGQKTLDCQILQEAVDIASKKKWI